MTGVKYLVKASKSVWGVTIRIMDKEAATAVMSYEFTGFTIDDAIDTANSKLNKCGYEIAGAATNEEIEAYYNDEW